MTTSDAIALAALVVSIYTIISSEVKSRKSDREQKVIKDEQDRLRKLLLEKETTIDSRYLIEGKLRLKI